MKGHPGRLVQTEQDNCKLKQSYFYLLIAEKAKQNNNKKKTPSKNEYALNA